MEITCWGSRGSISVSGEEYLRYGGDTTCIEIRTNNGDTVIVDAGTGIRRLGHRLIDENRHRYHFIFTHAHWDHLMGFPFFKPIYMRRTEMLMHRCPFDSQFVRTVLSRVMARPYFPVSYAELKASISYEDACPDEFDIGSMRVIPIPISHPDGGSGYKFVEDGKSFVFLTDNELNYTHHRGRSVEDYGEFSSGADLLIHDAEYTPDEYERLEKWGHSSYTDAVDLAVAYNVKRLGLFHINQDRTDDQMDSIVSDCRQRIDARGKDVDCFGVSGDMTFSL